MIKRRASAGLTGQVLATWLIAVGSVWAGEAETVRHWLDRMASAVSNLTYQGTLVNIRGVQTDTFRIYHRVDQSGMRERLVSISGAPREILRDNDTVRCIFPDRQSVVIDSRVTERLFPVIPADLAELSAGRYEFAVESADRIAEHEAEVIRIMPRDEFRYGYRLWLERNTGMLLKSHLLNERGKPVEQLLFTEIQIGGSIPDSDLLPDVRSQGFVQVTLPASEQITSSSTQPHWQVGKLPAGFARIGHRFAESLEHMVFTDGLASVSVYIEPVNEGKTPASGFSQMGAVNIYGHVVNGFSVTAVGEVPRKTLKMMAASVAQATP